MGYYVNNEYTEEELRDNPPDAPLIDRWAGGAGGWGWRLLGRAAGGGWAAGRGGPVACCMACLPHAVGTPAGCQQQDASTRCCRCCCHRRTFPLPCCIPAAADRRPSPLPPCCRHAGPLLPPCCRLHRSILADKPRVTKFNIEWDSAREASGMEVDS